MDDFDDGYDQGYASAKIDFAALKAENEQLRAALRVFAYTRYTTAYSNSSDQDWAYITSSTLTVGHFRRARVLVDTNK